MRRKTTVTFAFSFVLTGSVAFAQSGNPTQPQPVSQFTWRAPSTTSARAIQPTPTTLLQQPKSLRIATRQEDSDPTLRDTQPSVSDRPLLQGSIEPADPSVVKTPEQRMAPRALPTEVQAQPGIIYEAPESVMVTDAGQPIPQAPQATAPIISAQPPLGVIDAGDPVTPNYCDRNCRKSFCNLGCEKKLFGRNCNGLEIGGWTQLGYHNRDNIIFNDRRGEANLHQQWLYFDKQAGVTSNWGYRADALYGIDAQNTQAFGNSPTGAPSGWDNGWDNGAYGFALPQLYLQYDNSLWDVKIGKFFSPFGYEVVAAPQNFFYSHSYTMNFMEPFTMTGVIGERQMTDNWSSIFGATVGWDTGFERNAGGFNVITGSRYRPNEFVNLALTSSLGDTGSRDSGTLSSAVAQLKLTETVDYVFQADVLNLRRNNEFGIVQYLFKEVTPCLQLGSRLEWWKSDQLFTDTKSTYQFTMGANYRANANLIVRPELRFDWGAAAVDPGTPIFGIDAVMTY